MNFQETFRMTSKQIFDEFLAFAQEHKLEYEYKDGYYLWIKGNSTIALMAHVDTVEMDNTDTQTKILKEERGLLKAYYGGNRCILGADDRAGVHMIWEIVSKIANPYNIGSLPHVMLFNYEEVGGLGAEAFIANNPDFSNIELMISLDCSYHNRYVWYGKTNQFPEAMDFIESFGIADDGRGIFTDMMIIGDNCNIPCFNLAVGYVHQHSPNEYLDMGSYFMTLGKLTGIIYGAPKRFDFKNISDTVEDGIEEFERDKRRSVSYGKW